jgi:hypothetical protein
MTKQQNQKNMKPEILINHNVDKYALVKKLQTQAEESRDIADYILGNIAYGRPLGYADGKHAAYRELTERILKGEFDSEGFDETRR